MFELVVKSVYFILPVYLSNIAVVWLYFAGLKDAKGWLALPIDFNIRWGKHQQPIFGPHKRWEGIFTFSVVAILVVAVQVWLFQFSWWRSISIIPYDQINIYLVGFLFGFGSFCGDLFKSFIKRRLNFPPHSAFPVLDQLDHPIGGILFTYQLLRPEWPVIVTILLVTTPLVFLVNVVSYKLKIKDVWW